MFSTTRIKSNKSRFTVIAAGLLPILGIFVSNAIWRINQDDTEDVEGMPEPWVFVTAWTIIALVFLLSATVAAFRFDTAPLVMYGIALVLIAIVTFVWTYLNNGKDDKNSACQTLLLFVLLVLFAWTITLTAKCDQNQDDVRLVLGSLAVVPVGWSVAATVLGYVSANMKHV